MKTTAEYIALLKKYMQQSASRYGIIRMGIFGSVARQEQNECSDIDIYIEGELHGFFALSGIKVNWKNCWDVRLIWCVYGIKWIIFSSKR